MSDQTERLRNDLADLCRFCGAMPGVAAHDDDCLGVAVLAELEAVKAREEALSSWAEEAYLFLSDVPSAPEKLLMSRLRAVRKANLAASEPPGEEGT